MNIVEESKQQMVQHNDETCPNTENIKKLKGEIKRLRQDLILKGSSRKKDEEEYFSDDSALDEEEKAAVRMLPADQKKALAELEQAGANRQYIKKRIQQALI